MDAEETVTTMTTMITMIGGDCGFYVQSAFPACTKTLCSEQPRDIGQKRRRWIAPCRRLVKHSPRREKSEAISSYEHPPTMKDEVRFVKRLHGVAVPTPNAGRSRSHQLMRPSDAWPRFGVSLDRACVQEGRHEIERRPAVLRLCACASRNYLDCPCTVVSNVWRSDCQMLCDLDD